MSFLDKLPQHVKDLEKAEAELKAERNRIDWGSDGHECDCDYCDRQGEGAKAGDPDAQIQADVLDDRLKAVDMQRERLRRYAADHGIELK